MKHYYYIRWSDVVRMQKANNPCEACKLAFGIITENMEIKDLGTKNPKYLSNKKLQELKDNTQWNKIH